MAGPKMQVPGAQSLPSPVSQAKVTSSQWVSVTPSVKKGIATRGLQGSSRSKILEP